MKKYTLTGVFVLIFALLISGCGGPNWSKMSEKEITKALEQEKQILGGNVYKQDNMMVAAIVLSPEASNKFAEKLAQKYAKGLAERNPELIVNVQAVRDGKNVAFVLLEPQKK